MKLKEKAKIGRLLSHFIKEIATEEVAFVDRDSGEDLLITKAEAVARIIWRDALGWTEVPDSGKPIVHKPDKSMIHLIFDRIEGKVGSSEDYKKKDTKIYDKISDVAQKRINKLSNYGKEKEQL